MVISVGCDHGLINHHAVPQLVDGRWREQPVADSPLQQRQQLDPGGQRPDLRSLRARAMRGGACLFADRPSKSKRTSCVNPNASANGSHVGTMYAHYAHLVECGGIRSLHPQRPLLLSARVLGGLDALLLLLIRDIVATGTRVTQVGKPPRSTRPRESRQAHPLLRPLRRLLLLPSAHHDAFQHAHHRQVLLRPP